MTEVRIMQISGLNTSQAIPVVKAMTSPQTGNTVTVNSDRAEFNQSAASFSNLVQQASQMPEVRSEVVDAYKSRVASGQYPAQDVIAGLTRLIGGGIMQAAKSASSKS